MPVLIDGHNLIAHMPDMSLDDPEDEARLVMRLRAYNARTRKKITVIFDHGLPGGWSRELSTGPVEVVFAGAHTNADRVLLERLRATKNAPGLIVISSDREVRQAAQARGAHVVSAEKFAVDLMTPPSLSRQAQRERGDDVHLSQSEVEKWMQMFKPARKQGPK